MMQHSQYFDFDKVLEQEVYFVCDTFLSFFKIIIKKRKSFSIVKIIIRI